MFSWSLIFLSSFLEDVSQKGQRNEKKIVLQTGIEPAYPGLGSLHSTTVPLVLAATFNL